MQQSKGPSPWRAPHAKPRSCCSQQPYVDACTSTRVNIMQIYVNSFDVAQGAEVAFATRLHGNSFPSRHPWGHFNKPQL